MPNHPLQTQPKCIVYKMSDRKVKDLERIDQLKDDFLSTVSQELRSPITNIKIAIQLLKVLLQQEESRAIADSVLSSLSQPCEQSGDPLFNGVRGTQSLTAIQKQGIFRTRAAHYIQIMENEFDREINLLNNFLDLQQLDAGNYGLNQGVICLQDSILQVVEPFLDRMANQQQILHLEIADDLPILTIDSPSLERILTELLTNACKFTPLGGEITVTVFSYELTSVKFAEKLLLKVTNSSVEIPANELSRIFDRFYHITNRDRWKHNGTGLGLVLLRKLTEYLGGSILVKSGCGQTSFIVELPINLQLCDINH